MAVKPAKEITQDVIDDMASCFWGRVRRAGPADCWEWDGELDSRGYGRIERSGRRWLAHRIALALDGRTPSVDRFACHTCDNPRCVNPAHLFIGTNRDNALDCIRKGRARRAVGERNGMTTLSDDQVRRIRASRLPVKHLAERHRVTISTIYRLRKRVTWGHLA